MTEDTVSAVRTCQITRSFIWNQSKKDNVKKIVHPGNIAGTQFFFFFFGGGGDRPSTEQNDPEGSVHSAPFTDSTAALTLQDPDAMADMNIYVLVRSTCSED